MTNTSVDTTVIAEVTITKGEVPHPEPMGIEAEVEEAVEVAGVAETTLLKTPMEYNPL